MRSEVLARSGMHVVALEPDRAEAERLRARLGQRVEIRETPLQQGVLPRAHADLVIAWHVLEHLPDIDEALAEMMVALAPGGRLVVAVPNAASLEARAFGGRWHGWEPARHHWHFTPAALRRVLDAAGLEAIEVRTAGGWAVPTSLAYSLAPHRDHQLHEGRRPSGLALLAAAVPVAAVARLAGQGAQLIASATAPSVGAR
jgi:SAM-dependent methyltransferase